MKGTRREARYQRRKSGRDARRQQIFSQFGGFEHVADFDNLYQAFLSARRGVSWKESVQRYEANALRNIAETRRRLLAGEDVRRGFREFTIIERGKVRRIRSVHISERIVQKCLCDQVLVPLLTRPLIHDNGASLKGKGVHFALRRFIAHLSSYYRSSQSSNTGYALLIDFTNFFDNIDHRILFYLMGKQIKDRRIQNLIKKLVSVFGDGKSLGLGSQISQIAAIYYPNMLDHFIKETLRVKYYGRYMDDLYLIHADKNFLENCLEQIRTVCDKLKITINSRKTKIVKLSDGVVFLKGTYSLLPSGKVLRRPGNYPTSRMRRKLKKYKILLDKRKMTLADIRDSYQSWRGNYMRRFNAYHRIRFMDRLYNQLFMSN
jgi:hypothetical protein